MSRCISCNKDTPTYIMVKSSKKDNAIEYPCCSLKCFNKADKFFKYSSRGMSVLIPTLIVYMIIFALVLFRYLPTVYMAIAGVIMGLIIIVYPFNAQHISESWSIKKTKIAACISGGIIIYSSVLILF